MLVNIRMTVLHCYKSTLKYQTSLNVLCKHGYYYYCLRADVSSCCRVETCFKGVMTNKLPVNVCEVSYTMEL